MLVKFVLIDGKENAVIPLASPELTAADAAWEAAGAQAIDLTLRNKRWDIAMLKATKLFVEATIEKQTLSVAQLAAQSNRIDLAKASELVDEVP